ncbi:MAG TPA: flagellar biosynthesis anti-sigma factor FlgM, partial [Bacillota bacterium]|nr:flagellar biosynthesis anti-sigma factor FlgM [Bacillota bacterium]
MIISSLQINSMLKVYGKEGVRPNNLDRVRSSGAVPRSAGMDQTQVSNEARTFLAALKAAMNSPEVRETKVTELKDAINK